MLYRRKVISMYSFPMYSDLCMCFCLYILPGTLLYTYRSTHYKDSGLLLRFFFVAIDAISRRYAPIATKRRSWESVAIGHMVIGYCNKKCNRGNKVLYCNNHAGSCHIFSRGDTHLSPQCGLSR
jgi:hypothetical protein